MFFLASFLIVSLTHFVNKPDSSRDLIIFIISFISSLEIINVVVPDPNIFSWIAASVVDATAVNPNGIKTLLADGLRLFPILKTIHFLVKVLKVYLKILLIEMFYAIEFFDNFILADEPFAKALQSFEIVNNSLCRIFFLSFDSPTAFNEVFKVTSVPFLCEILIY